MDKPLPISYNHFTQSKINHDSHQKAVTKVQRRKRSELVLKLSVSPFQHITYLVRSPDRSGLALVQRILIPILGRQQPRRHKRR